MKVNSNWQLAVGLWQHLRHHPGQISDLAHYQAGTTGYVINAFGDATRAKALYTAACYAGLKALFHLTALKRIYEII